MIDEVVCSDWEAWKGWGSPHRGKGGGEREEKPTGPEKGLLPRLQGQGQSLPGPRAQVSAPHEPVSGGRALAGLRGQSSRPGLCLARAVLLDVQAGREKMLTCIKHTAPGPACHLRTLQGRHCSTLF